MALLPLLAAIDTTLLPLANVNIYWRDLPILIVAVSLVYGATRFDDWDHIVREACRWVVRLTAFLVVVMVVLYLVARFLI